MQTYTSTRIRKSSVSSEHSEGSSRSSGSRVREKLENRRSILNQVEDGKIRRTDTSNSNQQQRDPKVSAERNNDNEMQVYPGSPPMRRKDLERFKALLANKNTDSRSTTSTTSSSPSEAGQRVNSIASRSISRSRKRKEVAEEKLKSLFSAAALSGSFDGITFESPSLARTKSSISSDESSSVATLQPTPSRILFDHPAPTNDENNVICPSPRRANGQDVTRVFADMANLSVSVKPETPEEKPAEKDDTVFENDNLKHHFSQQMNIRVMDNFFTIRL